MNKIPILSLSHEELKDQLNQHKIESYRYKQIKEWIYHKKVAHFSLMNNIPNTLKELLENHFIITSLEILETHHSRVNKGTSKMVLQTDDGHFIEMVIIPNSKGLFTLCVSSQIGCDMACDFCATGKLGLTRSLTIEEVLGQFFLASQEFSISNIVFMGMGEPFLNPDIFSILDRFVSSDYFHFQDRSITVSTSGIVEGINHMAQYKQIKLALSYHSSIPEIRQVLFPVLHMRHSLDELKNAIINYHSQTKKRITLEYTLMKGVNDTKKEAESLLELSQELYFFLNIIPYNENELSSYKTPSNNDIQRFVSYLKKKIPTNVRSSQGSDIMAACGQLAFNKKSRLYKTL